MAARTVAALEARIAALEAQLAALMHEFELAKDAASADHYEIGLLKTDVDALKTQPKAAAPIQRTNQARPVERPTQVTIDAAEREGYLTVVKHFANREVRNTISEKSLEGFLKSAEGAVVNDHRTQIEVAAGK